MATFWTVVVFAILNVLIGVCGICYSLYNIYTLYGIEMLVISIAIVMFLFVFLIAAIVQLWRIIKNRIERLRNMTFKELLQLVIEKLKG